MKFSIALTDLESLLRAVSCTRPHKADVLTLSACAGRVFVGSHEAVAGMETLVLAEGEVRLVMQGFRKVLRTYKGVGVVVFEGGPEGLRIQNFRMPVLAYDPAPLPPAEFQVLRTSAFSSSRESNDSTRS